MLCWNYDPDGCLCVCVLTAYIIYTVYNTYIDSGKSIDVLYIGIILSNPDTIGPD